MTQLTTKILEEYASYLRAHDLTEPQLATQWLRLNSGFVTTCKAELERIIQDEPLCISAHIFDFDLSELVRSARPGGAMTSINLLLRWLRTYRRDGQSTSHPVKLHGRDIADPQRRTIVGPDEFGNFLVEVPIFNLPLTVGLVCQPDLLEEAAVELARTRVINLCERYLSSLLNIPLLPEVLLERIRRMQASQHHQAGSTPNHASGT